MPGVDPFEAGMLPSYRSTALARNWWAVLIRGALALLFGLVALVLPGPTLASLVLLFGAYMAVDGVFAIVAGARAAAHHERWGELMIEGVLGLVAASIAFFAPLATILAVVILAAVWAVVSGVALLIGAFHLHGTHGRTLMALGGVVSIVWGVLLYWFPAAGAVVMTYWLGIYALLFGAALVALALRLRRRAM